MSGSTAAMDSSTTAPATVDPSAGSPPTRIVFSAWDYVVFVAVLLVSALIGVWYAFRGRRSRSNKEFLLLGNRKMSAIPVALSLIASFISAISITGLSSEWYTRGLQFLVASGGGMIAMLLVAYLFLPVFYPLRFISVYEYLEVRYNSKLMRILGAALSTIQTLLYMSVVLYAPSLAINAVTNFPIWSSILLVGGVCTFYTSIGGLKAVVWTDVFQSFVMYAALITIIVWGSVNVGGVDVVWKVAHKYGRTTTFNLSADPTEYQTIWGIFFNGVFLWLGAYGVSQTAIQRYCAMPSMLQARKALLINMPGFVIIGLLCGWCGFAIFATYEGCDPLAMGVIKKKDQILPYFVVDKLHIYPGVGGLFVASLFSGALSSVSSGVNSLAAIAWEDVLKTRLQHKGDQFAARCCKLIAFGYGLLSIVFAFAVSNLGGVLQTSLMLVGSIGGPMLGMFILGMFFTSTNWVGAFAGTMSSLVLMIWISAGRMANIRYVTPPYLPSTGTSQCQVPAANGTESTTVMTSTVTSTATEIIEERVITPDVFVLYRISYLWYPFFGMLVCIVIGIAVSYISRYFCPRIRTQPPPAANLVYPLADILRCRGRASSDLGKRDISAPQISYHMEDESCSEDEYDHRMVTLKPNPDSNEKPVPFTTL